MLVCSNVEGRDHEQHLMMAWLSRSVKSPSTDKEEQHQRKINANRGACEIPPITGNFAFLFILKNSLVLFSPFTTSIPYSYNKTI